MILFTIFTLSLTIQSYAQEGSRVDTVYKNITDPSMYNKWFMPPLENGNPLDIQVRAYVYYINTKETNKLKITMHLLLEVLWKDSRLRYDKEKMGLSAITGGKKLLKGIWRPQIYLKNNFESHILGSMSKDYFITLLPTGLVVLTTRVKAAMSCVQNLAKFPFDEQNCELFIHSWANNSSKLVLSWEDNVALEFRDLEESFIEFDVVSVENTNSFFKSANIGDDKKGLSIQMRLGRRYGYYFLNYYLPSMLIVIVSWVSFWLDPSAHPGRITLGASTMLTFIQLCWSVQEEQKVSQFMVYDVWACGCTAFIFLSLVEFSFVNSIDRKGRGKLYLKKLSSKHILRGGVDTAAGRAQLRRSSSCPSSPELRRKTARKQDTPITIKELKQVSASLGNLAHEGGTNGNKPTTYIFSMTPQQIARWIDNKSKIVFPIAFVIFIISYWLPILLVK